MSTRVTWQPSSDLAIYSYVLQSSTDTVAWTTLDTIVDAPRSGANPHWDATNSVFFYTDAAGTSSTWYRLAAVDTLAQQSAWSPAFQPAGIPVPTWATAGEIINDAMSEIGLGTDPDPYTSTDANFIQACSLLKSLGRDVVAFRGWSHLRGEHTFTTVAGQADYPLPADYYSMVPQTGWNRSNLTPLVGPASPQVWNYLMAGNFGGTVNVTFRGMNRRLSIYPTTGGMDISFEYSSRYWVSLAGTPDTASSETPLHSTDLVWFSPLLMVRGLKMLMLRAKGFDSTGASQEYSRTLELAKSHDAPSPVLSVTYNRRSAGFRFIDGRNIPETGYGA
jgi:hypothetical protein